MRPSNVAWVVFIVIVIVGLSLIFWHPRGTITPTDWLTFTDEAKVYTFNYPKDFGSEYVTPVDWPPMINLLEGTEFNCVDGAGSIYARAGETKRKVIGGQEYCVTVVSEGAAGSTYNQYAYLTEKDNQIIGLLFTARLPQCLNYDEPKRGACQADQAAFNPDALTHQMITSLEFTQ